MTIASRLLAAALLALVWACAPAHAHSMSCNQTSRLIHKVVNEYKGVFQAGGSTILGNAVSFWVSPDGDWGLLIHYPDDKSCIIKSGIEWGTLPDPSPLRGEPS